MLSIGLGRVRVPPRTLLITDCVLRSLTFATLGVLAVTDQLTLEVLVVGLLFGATFRMAGSSGRRLLAAVLMSVPRAVDDRDALRRPTYRESGWRILRGRPAAARLLVVEFFLNFLYMPIDRPRVRLFGGPVSRILGAWIFR